MAESASVGRFEIHAPARGDGRVVFQHDTTERLVSEVRVSHAVRDRAEAVEARSGDVEDHVMRDRVAWVAGGVCCQSTRIVDVERAAVDGDDSIRRAKGTRTAVRAELEDAV